MDPIQAQLIHDLFDNDRHDGGYYISGLGTRGANEIERLIEIVDHYKKENHQLRKSIEDIGLDVDQLL